MMAIQSARKRICGNFYARNSLSRNDDGCRLRPQPQLLAKPRGRRFVTLKDESPQWQAAIEALIMAAKDPRPLMRDRLAPTVGLSCLRGVRAAKDRQFRLKEDAR